MGIPAFFGWLIMKYPAIVIECLEEELKDENLQKVPVDSSQPNPHFDNLYIDMNGIIHPCCHPEDRPAPKDETERMIAVFEYIDRIFRIVRPKRLLYIAIDGVAPKAKMNQQRSRRFCAAKEMAEKVDLISKLREELQGKGVNLPPKKPKEELFDNNCITPGTPFMMCLAKYLQYYICDRLNNDPKWKNIVVILSDANVPGEGEHKIMEFIRKQRISTEYDANTKHCLCGSDADLIMLGLATHEPHFTIIREKLRPKQPKACEICGTLGHSIEKCTGCDMENQSELPEPKTPFDIKFLFIKLNVLREYLASELKIQKLPFAFDFEKALDDFVFLCFLVGNDFLPQLPSLEIREGAVDLLIEIYKKVLPITGQFLTNSGEVQLKSIQLIMIELAKIENDVFKRRKELELNFLRRQQRQKKKQRKSLNMPSPVQVGSRFKSQGEVASMIRPSSSDSSALGAKRKKEGSDSEEEAELKGKPEPDLIRLFEGGGKERYYKVKFNVEKDVAFRQKLAEEYVKGLCWLLKYYYQGCASWDWYFPYHYAPFASDFNNIEHTKINFDKSMPLKPLEQLLSVLPASSKKHLPECFGELMYNLDSPLLQYYPTDFKIDLNFKKYPWQGVVLLPFVEKEKLLKAVKPLYPKLNKAEKLRNAVEKPILYVGRTHQAYPYIASLYETGANLKKVIEMKPKLFSGTSGTIILSEDVVLPNTNIPSPLPGLPDIPGNAAQWINFENPTFDEDFIFPSEKLKSAIDPPKVLVPGQMPVIAFRNRFT